MFEGIQRGLKDALGKLPRPWPAHRRQHPRRPARSPPGVPRSRRQLQRHQRLHRHASRRRRSARTCWSGSTPPTRSSRSSSTNSSQLMGPVDHKIPVFKDRAGRADDVRPPGLGQNDDVRQAGADAAATRAAGRCSSPPTCSGPAAVEQLQSPRRADQHPGLLGSTSPVQVCKNAIGYAKQHSLRHHHPRHRRPVADRPGVDGRAEPDRPPGSAGSCLSRRRCDDRPGGRERRQGVQRCA